MGQQGQAAIRVERVRAPRRVEARHVRVRDAIHSLSPELRDQVEPQVALILRYGRGLLLRSRVLGQVAFRELLERGDRLGSIPLLAWILPFRNVAAQRQGFRPSLVRGQVAVPADRQPPLPPVGAILEKVVAFAAGAKPDAETRQLGVPQGPSVEGLDWCSPEIC